MPKTKANKLKTKAMLTKRAQIEAAYKAYAAAAEMSRAEDLMMEANELKRASREATDVGTAELAEGLSGIQLAQEMAQLRDTATANALRDMTQGEAMLTVSQDISKMSSLVQAMGSVQVARGMELAGMSGQIGVVGEVLNTMGQLALGTFLGDMSLRIKAFAIGDLSRAEGTADLARSISVTGKQVADYGKDEVRDGIEAFAAAEVAADANEYANEVGQAKIAEGLADIAAAEGMNDMSHAMSLNSLGDITKSAGNLDAE